MNKFFAIIRFYIFAVRRVTVIALEEIFKKDQNLRGSRKGDDKLNMTFHHEIPKLFSVTPKTFVFGGCFERLPNGFAGDGD